MLVNFIYKNRPGVTSECVINPENIVFATPVPFLDVDTNMYRLKMIDNSELYIDEESYNKIKEYFW